MVEVVVLVPKPLHGRLWVKGLPLHGPAPGGVAEEVVVEQQVVQSA